MLLMSFSTLKTPGIKQLVLQIKPNWPQLYQGIQTEKLGEHERGRIMLILTTVLFCLN